MPAGFEESDKELRNLLQNAKTIAVVGAKDQRSEDAYRVPLYMQQAGYRVIPVNPKLSLALDPPPKAVWMQLGIHHGEAAQRLREAGIGVIQDRCIMVDHRRLVGASA